MPPPALTFEFCLRRLIAKPPTLSRLDASNLRTALRNALAFDIYRRADLIPNGTVIPPVSDHDAFDFLSTCIAPLPRRFDVTLSSDVAIFASDDARKEAVRMYALHMGHESPDPRQVNETLADEVGGTRKRFSKVRPFAKSREGLTQWTLAKTGSVISTEHSQSYLLHKITSAMNKHIPNIRAMFPSDPDVAEGFIHLGRLVIQSEYVVGYCSTSPPNARYNSSMMHHQAADLYSFSMEWVPTVAKIRKCMRQPSTRAMQSEEVLRKLTQDYMIALEAIREVFSQSSECMIDSATMLWAADGEASQWRVFDRQRYLDRTRRGLVGGDLVEVPSQGLARGGASLPSAIYSTRRLVSMDVCTMRDLVVVAEIFTEISGAIIHKNARRVKNGLSSSDSPRIHRAMAEFREAHAAMAQAVGGIMQCILLELCRRLYTGDGPVSSHELALLVRARCFRQGSSSLSYPSRTFWIGASPIQMVPVSVLKAMGSRGLHMDALSQASFPYLFWLINRIIDAPDDEKEKFWRRHIRGPLSIQLELSWSFYNFAQISRQIATSPMAKALRRAVCNGPIAAGWLSLSHLAVHSSWLEPGTPQSLSRMVRQLYTGDNALPAGAHWGPVLAKCVESPDAKTGNLRLLAQLAGGVDDGSGTVCYHAGVALDEQRIRRVSNSIRDVSTRVDIGNSLFMLCHFSSLCVFTDPIMMANLYESYRDQLPFEDGLHCMMLAALLRCGPLTREHMAAVEAMLPIATASSVSADVYACTANTFSDIYGFVSLIMVSYVDREWFEVNCPSMIGLGQASGDGSVVVSRPNPLPKVVRRILQLFFVGTDSFMLPILAVFFGALEKWSHAQLSVMQVLRTMFFTLPKKFQRDLGFGTELTGIMGATLIAHRATPSLYALPQSIDYLYQRMHRMLCLHDDSLPYFKSHWSELGRCNLLARGTWRAVNLLLQQSFKNSTQIHGAFPGTPITLRHAWITEIAQIKCPVELSHSLCSWWYANRVSRLTAKTLLDAHEFVGCSMHVLGALVSLADRLLRDPYMRETLQHSAPHQGHVVTEILPDFGGGMSRWGSGRGATSFCVPVDDRSDIAEAISGMDLAERMACNRQVPHSDAMGSSVTTGDEGCEVESGGGQFGRPAPARPHHQTTPPAVAIYDPLLYRNLRIDWQGEFLGVLFMDLARFLVSSTSLACVRAEGGLNHNRLLQMPWPHPGRAVIKARDNAYRAVFGETATNLMINREPEKFVVNEDYLDAVELFAAWSCAFEISAFIGAAPQGLSVDEAWDCVCMRLMPPSVLNAALTTDADGTVAQGLLKRYARQFDKKTKRMAPSAVPEGTIGAQAHTRWERRYAVTRAKWGRCEKILSPTVLVADFAPMGLGLCEQIEFLGAVAGAMSHPMCTVVVSNSARRLFSAHTAELFTALLFRMDALSGESRRGEDLLLCSVGDGLDVLAGSNGERLASIVAVAFALDLHLAPNSPVMLLAQRLGLTLEATSNAPRIELRARIGKATRAVVGPNPVGVAAEAKGDLPASVNQLDETFE